MLYSLKIFEMHQNNLFAKALKPATPFARNVLLIRQRSNWFALTS